VVHFNLTAHPTAEWTAQRLPEAFPFEQIPRYLLRDGDKIFGDEFGRQVRDLNLEEVLSAPRSPWHLTGYFSYYHATRPHLSLEKDSPELRRFRQSTAPTFEEQSRQSCS
jgi:hypothetical protein